LIIVKGKGERKKVRSEKRVGGQRGLRKPYDCPHGQYGCGMSYHDERELRLHIRSWHGIRDDQPKKVTKNA